MAIQTYGDVRDGTIMALAAEDGVKSGENTCLIWRERADHFELRLKFRLHNVLTARPANSGLLYRGRKLDDWQVRGYQADLSGDHTGTLLLLREDARDPRVDLAHSAVLRTEKGLPVIKSKKRLSPAESLKDLFKKGEWNELVVVAQGNHLIHRINGVVTADVFEESDPPPALSGFLALELKRATTVQFKDIRLKRLPPTAPARR